MKFLSLLAIVVGILLIVLAIIYFMTPAGSLPHVIPGYEVGSIKIHIKHGIASLLLGIAALILAWFQSGKKKA